MPAQLPATTEDGIPILTTWINNTCAATITSDLTREERAWFRRRWIQELIEYYRGKGFACRIEIAAVITVFERPAAISQMPSSTPPPSGLASTGSTKYDIDPTLTGKARERAKKNAAKAIKKEAARRKDGNGNDVMGGAGGAGGASTSV